MQVFIMKINIRFMDIDAMGHVNHATIISYFAEGRNEFLRDMFDEFKPASFPFILKYLECNYLQPIDLQADLRLKIWVKEIKNKSFKLGYNLLDNDKDNITSYAHCESIQICYDYNQNKSTEISNKLRQKLLNYHVDSSKD